MKKFVFIYVGFDEPTPEMMEAWGKWFESFGDNMVDSGNPFGPGREISQGETKELPLGSDSISGYTIINAENMDEAAKIAQGCPTIKGIRVYEAMAM